MDEPLKGHLEESEAKRWLGSKQRVTQPSEGALSHVGKRTVQAKMGGRGCPSV